VSAAVAGEHEATLGADERDLEPACVPPRVADDAVARGEPVGDDDGLGDDAVRTLVDDEMLEAVAGPGLPARDDTGYSGSGRSTSVWHSVHTQVLRIAFVALSRRSVQGMSAIRPQRGQRSGRAPGGRTDGSHGTLAGMRRS